MSAHPAAEATRAMLMSVADVAQGFHAPSTAALIRGEAATYYLLVAAVEDLLASAPPHLTHRNAAESDAYTRIRKAIAGIKE